MPKCHFSPAKIDNYRDIYIYFINFYLIYNCVILNIL